MLVDLLPVTDIFLNVYGSITIDVFKGSNPDIVADPEDSAVVTIEDMTKEFIRNCKESDGYISHYENVNAAYNLLDSFRNAIKMLEDVIYDEELDNEDKKGNE